MDDDGGMDVSEYDDEDIYGDLESEIFTAPAKRPRVEDLREHEEYQNLKTENHTLKIKIKQLERENKAYSNNISSLYLTAKNEIDKKNHIIKNLTTKMKEVTKCQSKLSNDEAEEILKRCQEGLQESQSQVTLNEIQRCFKNFSPSGKPRKKKLIKWGNMSMYFFQEQGSFQREETVTFPNGSGSTCTTDTASGSQETSGDLRMCNSITGDNEERHEEQHNGSLTSVVKKTNEVKNLPVPKLEICETDTRRERRNSEKDVNRIDCDRDKINQRNSGDRYSLRHTRSRDFSPSNDRRHSRKEDEDRNHVRDKEYDDRKSGNRRQSSWVNNHDHRTRHSRRFKNEKFSNSNYSTNSRSRSKSK